MISDLSTTVDTGTSPVGALQIGETQTGRTYDVVFDDAAFGTSRLGPVADTTAPSVPVNVTADATSPFSVSLAWDAATDDVGVTGYDVFRDGALLTSLGAVTSFTDDIVLSSSTYTYQVRARDVAREPLGAERRRLGDHTSGLAAVVHGRIRDGRTCRRGPPAPG